MNLLTVVDIFAEKYILFSEFFIIIFYKIVNIFWFVFCFVLWIKGVVLGTKI